MWYSNDSDSESDNRPEPTELEDFGELDSDIPPWNKPGIFPATLWAKEIGPYLDPASRNSMRQTSKYFNNILSPPPLNQLPSPSGKAIVKHIKCLSPIRSLVEYPPNIIQDVLISGHQDGTICVWDITAGTCLSTLRNSSLPVTHLAVFRNDWLISGARDGIRIWNQDGNCLKTIPLLNGYKINGLVASRNSSWFVYIATNGKETLITGMDCNDLSSVSLSSFLSTRLSRYDRAITNIGDERIAFSSDGLNLMIFNTKTKEQELCIQQKSQISCLASLGTSWLACATFTTTSNGKRQGAIHIYNWETGELIRKIESSLLNLSPIFYMIPFDNGYLVTMHLHNYSEEELLCIWNAKTSELRNYRLPGVIPYQYHTASAVKLNNYRFAEAKNAENSNLILIQDLGGIQPRPQVQKDTCILQ